MNLLLYLILAALLGGGALDRVEEGVEARFRQQFGEIRHVKVDVKRGRLSPLSRTIEKISIELEGFELNALPGDSSMLNLGRDTMAGKINQIEVTAKDFEISGLAVKEMQISLRRMRYNLKKALWRKRLEVIDLKSCKGTITLEESALEEYIAPKVRSMEEFSLNLGQGEVEIAGKVKTRLRLAVPIRLTARVQPDLGRIYLTEPKLKVSSVPVPGIVTKVVIDQINPVVDLNSDPEIPVLVDLRTLNVEPTQLKAEGEIVIVRKRLQQKSEANKTSAEPATAIKERD